MIAGLRTPDKAYIKINDRLITDTEHKSQSENTKSQNWLFIPRLPIVS